MRMPVIAPTAGVPFALALLAAGGCAAAPPPALPVPAPDLRAALPPAPTAGAFTRPLTAAEQRWIDATVARLALRDRVAQLVNVWVLGDYASTGDSSFARPLALVTRERVGGITMSLGSPIEVAAKVDALQRAAVAATGIPLLVGSDVEPGLGRLEGGAFVPQLWSAGGATVLPSAMAIGAAGREDDAAALGRITGREARASGIHVAFAPVVDVNNNPANPVINVRSFGEDPAAVARLSAAFVRGVQETGTAAVVKHFPGHGDTDADSHVALPVVRSDRARLDRVELVPFRWAFAAGAAGVMSAHVALPAVQGDATPATLAPRVMTGLLRDTLAFAGIAFTDAMDMAGVGQGYAPDRACALALAAGNDVLLMPADVPRCLDGVVAAVGRGELTAARIEASLRRLLALKVRTGAAFRPYADLDALRALVGAPAHRAAAAEVAARAVTLLRDSAALVPLAAGAPTTVVVYAPDAEVATGPAFVAELRRGGRVTRDVRVSPRTGAATLDSIAAAIPAGGTLVVLTYTRTFEGSGRLAIPAHVAAWIDAQAARRPTVVVAAGNPYVIRQFPRVTSYLVTYGRGEALERAAARALLGAAPITGRTPISLPGFFARGDGLQRPLVGSVGR